jgi:peptidoglycan/xylan/chitin deacetylase (PgdA/CDA1 family)
MFASVKRPAADGDLARVRVSTSALPDRIGWAGDLWVSVPQPLAARLAASDYDDPETHLLADRSVDHLRMRRAYTPVPPVSARLPFSYRRIPGPARRQLARAMGYLQWVRRRSWTSYPGWPIDLSADFAADLAGHPNVAFARTPVLLTHDIDSPEGLENFVREFLPIEEAVGARSANYVVPHAWPLDYRLLDAVAARGHEIGVHGYDHANRTAFLPGPERTQRLARGREFGNRYGVVGYRAPSLLRTEALLADLAPLYDYDSSIPTSGGPFPVPNNGCASARPWRIGHLWEIPITLPRDGSLRFLGYSPAGILRLWKETALTAARSGGIISLLTHCERGFSGNRPMLAAYRAFVEYAATQFTFYTPRDLVTALQKTAVPRP